MSEDRDDCDRDVRDPGGEAGGLGVRAARLVVLAFCCPVLAIILPVYGLAALGEKLLGGRPKPAEGHVRRPLPAAEYSRRSAPPTPPPRSVA